MAYKALYISPMIPSYSLEATSRFFKDVLGFDAVMDTDAYKVLNKDGLTIHLLPAGEDIAQMEFYLEVNDIDGLWQDIKTKLEGIQHKPPFNREYGMREIHLHIPETNTLLFIGQEIT